MADFIKCILVIFEFGIFYHIDESITTANRYPTLYNRCPIIPIGTFINSTDWPANYISEIKRVGNSTNFPVVCIPLVKDIDEVIKKLAYDGYNISIISPKHEDVYHKCIVGDLAMEMINGNIDYLLDYPHQDHYYGSEMFSEVTDVVNRLKSNSSIASSNCVKFIEADCNLSLIFEDAGKMESHNNIYITNSYKYANLMAAFYPSSSTYTLPRQCQNSIDPMIKIIDECLSEKNDNRAVIIYIEDTDLTFDIERHYMLNKSNDQIIPLFQIMYKAWSNVEI